MRITTANDWNLVITRIADERHAPLICDGIRVLLSKSFCRDAWKSFITPIVEGTNYEQDYCLLLHGEHITDEIKEILKTFYYARYHYTRKRKRKKRYIWAYDSFPHPNHLIKQYSKNFQHIELLENVSDALFSDQKGLPPGMENQLPHPPLALPCEVTS